MFLADCVLFGGFVLSSEPIFSCDHILGVTGTPVRSTMMFSFTGEQILNSNSMPKHTFLLSRKKRVLRKIASQHGSGWHIVPSLAMASVELADIIAERKTAKSRARKDMNTCGTPTSEQAGILGEIDAMYEEHVSGLSAFVGEGTHNDYLYDKCKVSVGVSIPTGRDFDPPNLYPTVKPLVDGLTDSLWWVDDNHNIITSTEFHYLPPNMLGNKMYVLVLTVDAVDDDGIPLLKD